MANLQNECCNANDSSNNFEAERICILEYLEVVLCGWKLITILTVLAFVLSLVISISLPNVYKATTRILPPQQDSGLLGLMLGQAGSFGGVGPLATDLLGKANPADMYVSIMTSEAISDKIIDKFNLMKVYNEKYRIDAYKVLDNNIDILAGKKDGIITISVEDEDPQRAANIANAYVNELSNLLVQLNSKESAQNRVFYEERLAKAKVDLARSEDNLKQFQTKYKVVSVADQAQAAISNIAQLNAQLIAQEIQLSNLRKQFTEDSLEVKNVKSTINGLRNQISRIESREAGGAIPNMGLIPELGQQYFRLMREFKVQEAIVDLLTKQFESAKLGELKDSYYVQIIQTARVPDKKSKPKRSMIVAMSTVITFGFGILSVIIMHMLSKLPSNELVVWNRIKSRVVKRI
ncbi:lipopolysaccharide biosynthesis protein [Geobacter sulfurreducens]|uniref:Polysaccharide chain length determinant protein n=1 Tax=Geobacter sulfurreducens (strain ATCC 51573 / DSM 12127 / PCA) TaxID=243231 RepID=Q74C20_GEOSL|nr:Wzz/FepE/Etk N-terminal domain-containing protein [Geobacter sulfurreducens]AAR35232.1 polysaccharide chain length determinant protein [Geobacter sulfurreducens PCA]UAC02598.1 lipopolysaccharide biosynthesis protein [Geobacter sulfurreducens]